MPSRRTPSKAAFKTRERPTTPHDHDDVTELLWYEAERAEQLRIIAELENERVAKANIIRAERHRIEAERKIGKHLPAASRKNDGGFERLINSGGGGSPELELTEAVAREGTPLVVSRGGGGGGYSATAQSPEQAPGAAAASRGKREQQQQQQQQQQDLEQPHSGQPRSGQPHSGQHWQLQRRRRAAGCGRAVGLGLLAAVLGLGLALAAVGTLESWRRRRPGPRSLSVLLTADPGTLVGLPERAVLEGLLDAGTAAPELRGAAMCDQVSLSLGLGSGLELRLGLGGWPSLSFEDRASFSGLLIV